MNGRHEAIRLNLRVSAEIKIEELRVIEYMLSLMIQAAKESGRER
ncbi:MULTISPECIES: hypothetical protein [unclassified Bradyrhizobium]|nr:MULTISPECIES: hypothetical protein [unclassified Bradyrhizobium]